MRRESANCCSVRRRAAVGACARAGSAPFAPFLYTGASATRAGSGPKCSISIAGTAEGWSLRAERTAPRDGGLRCGLGSTHPLARAPVDARPRANPRRPPLQPAWGDCAEPIALLAASARLHGRPAPRRPGGAPKYSSRRRRLSRRLARPPPRSRRGNSDGRERREGERGGESPRGAAPAAPATPSPGEGPLAAGLRAAGAGLGSPGVDERGPGVRQQTGSGAGGRASGISGLAASWKGKSEALTALSREGRQPGKTVARCWGWKPRPETSFCALGSQGI